MDQQVQEQGKQTLTKFSLVLIIVSCIIAALYYFNIISHPPTKQNEPTADNQSNYSSVKQNEKQQAENLLTQFVKDNLKESTLLPPNSKVEQSTMNVYDAKNKSNKALKYYALLPLTKRESSISAILRYDNDVISYDYLYIIIQPSNAGQTPTTLAQANSLLSSYFKNPYELSTCGEQGKLCENIQTTAKGKVSYVVTTLTLADKTEKLFLFGCFIPKESKVYSTAKSCLGL
jgi:hypothetical protein